MFCGNQPLCVITVVNTVLMPRFEGISTLRLIRVGTGQQITVNFYYWVTGHHTTVNFRSFFMFDPDDMIWSVDCSFWQICSID